MPSLPEPIHQAAAAFDSLPGVGPRAALRYVYWLLTQPKETIQRFAKNIDNLSQHVTLCQICFQLAEHSPCHICGDSRRDHTLLCVVGTSQDLRAIEETGVFKGVYHVLGGTIDPIEGRTPDTLTIRPLLERLRCAPTDFREVILAMDADIPGDTTSLYIRKQIAGLSIRMTRLARGLPTGAILEYADAHTLADALTHRRETKE